MQIKVKLFATLRINRDKETELDLPEESTIKTVIDRLGIDQKDAAITFVNGRNEKLDHQLKNNDVLSIFPPVGGG